MMADRIGNWQIIATKTHRRWLHVLANIVQASLTIEPQNRARVTWRLRHVKTGTVRTVTSNCESEARERIAREEFDPA